MAGPPGHRRTNRGETHRQFLEKQATDVHHQFAVAGQPVQEGVLVEGGRGGNRRVYNATVAILLDHGK